MGAEFSWGNLRGREYLEDLGLHGKNMNMDLQEIGKGGGACTGLMWFRLRKTDGLL